MQDILQSIPPVGYLVGFVILVLILMTRGGGRKNRYFCRRCGITFRGPRHHGAFVPHCPNCRRNDAIIPA